MDINTGPIEWVTKWLDWLHRELSELLLELLDREGRERVWKRIKAHLREWIVYYVFGVCLLVIGCGLWMADDDDIGDGKVARGSDMESGTVRKGVMTGGGGEGPTQVTLGYAATGHTPKPRVNPFLSREGKALIPVNKNIKEKLGIVSESNLQHASEASSEQKSLTHKQLERNKNLNDKLTQVLTQTQTKQPTPKGNQVEELGGGGEGNKGKGTKSAEIELNKPIPGESKLIPEQPRQSLVKENVKQALPQIAKIRNEKTIPDPYNKPPPKPSANAHAPPEQLGIPIEASASSSVNISVSIDSGAQPAAPAAPTANAPKPAKTNNQPEGGEKPHAGQPQAPAGQQPVQQQPTGPQKTGRKDQGADAIQAAVAAVKQKQAQKTAEKGALKQQGKQYTAQAKEVSKQFKRPSAGSAEAGRLLDEVKRGVGQQFDRLGSILFSLLTAIGLATAAGVTTLKETGYEPAKKVAAMAMHI